MNRSSTARRCESAGNPVNYPSWRRAMRVMAVVACGALLAACDTQVAEPSCKETLRVWARNGQRVVQAVNGIYLRESFPVARCGSRRMSGDPRMRNWVTAGAMQMWWWKGQLYGADQLRSAQRQGLAVPIDAPQVRAWFEFHEAAPGDAGAEAAGAPAQIGARIDIPSSAAQDGDQIRAAMALQLAAYTVD